MSSKFDLPSLTNACLAFLLPSAAGRPVLVMKIAEVRSLPRSFAFVPSDQLSTCRTTTSPNCTVKARATFSTITAIGQAKSWLN